MGERGIKGAMVHINVLAIIIMFVVYLGKERTSWTERISRDERNCGMYILL